MSKATPTYTVTWSNGEESFTATRARKDAAIKFGDALGADYTVTTDSGTVVHTYAAPVSAPDTDTVTVRKGTKWTDLYVDDKRIAGLSNAHLDAILAYFDATRP